jgi:hypothetical protein
MTIYVAEFSTFGVDPNSGQAIMKMPPLVEQKLSTPGASNPFSSATKAIRVHTDAICSIAIGTNVVGATTSNMRLAANQTEYFFVNAGDQLASTSNV